MGYMQIFVYADPHDSSKSQIHRTKSYDPMDLNIANALWYIFKEPIKSDDTEI